MSFFIKKLYSTKAQASLEAAYLIPVIFILLLLMIQPGIVLYNHMVMQAAASEGCRLLATKTDQAGTGADKYESYILRRLGAVPPQDNFHLHKNDCSWEIELIGDENSEYVEVNITNKMKFLPLFDASGAMLGITDITGAYTQKVSCKMPTQAAWVSENELGRDPQAWIEKWEQ